jgi:hypothetical protein
MGVTVSWATHGGVEEAFGSRFLNSTENRRNYSIPIQLFICKSTSFVWGGSWFDAWVVGSSFETIYFPWGEWPVMAVFPLPDLGSRRTTILKYVLHEFAIYGHGTTTFLQHVKVVSGSVITPLEANQADGSVKKVEDIKGFTISSTVVCVCKFKWDAIFAKLYCWSCLWYDQASWKPSTLPSDHPNTPGLRGLPPSSKPWRLNGGNPRWPCRHVWPACAYYLVHHQHCSILRWPFQIRLYQVINYVNSSGKYRTM